MSADDIGTKAMSYGEAIDHVGLLLQDPSSWIQASVAGWDHPASREWFVLADQFDAFVQANTPKGRKVEPYQRPLSDKTRPVDKIGEVIEPRDMADVLRGFGRNVPAELVSQN